MGWVSSQAGTYVDAQWEYFPGSAKGARNLCASQRSLPLFCARGNSAMRLGPLFFLLRRVIGGIRINRDWARAFVSVAAHGRLEKIEKIG
jgi:hypothetical protein